MARLIDQDPAVPFKELQVCCVGLPRCAFALLQSFERKQLRKSRTGTTSLYSALTKLGYRTYHGFEFVENGKRDMDLLHEALVLKHRRQSEAHPYGRAEFDKVWSKYDAVIDLPGFAFVDELVEAYPNAKFILTLRNEDSWLTSVRKTVFPHMDSWQLFLQSLYDAQHARPLRRLLREWCDVFCGMDSGDAARAAYRRHNQHCIGRISQDRLLILPLETGIDWKTLCDFLGREQPDTRYPFENNSEMYREITSKMRKQGFWQPLRRVALFSCVVGCIVGLVLRRVWHFDSTQSKGVDDLS